MKKLILIIASLYMAQSCKVQTPLADQPMFSDLEVQRVTQRAFEQAGGWDKWQNLEMISFKKQSVLYLADGSTERDVTQFHEYQLKPELSGSIFWKDSEGSHSIIYKNGGAEQFLNGQKVKGKDDMAQMTFLNSYYALFVPFKLADPGVELFYAGVETLEKGEKVDVIKANYISSDQAKHSTDDTWYYYFDQSTGDYLGSMQVHVPAYTFIRNSSINRELPLAMNTYRESYRTDENRNIEYLSGEFFYNDYIMTFAEE